MDVPPPAMTVPLWITEADVARLSAIGNDTSVADEAQWRG